MDMVTSNIKTIIPGLPGAKFLYFFGPESYNTVWGFQFEFFFSKMAKDDLLGVKEQRMSDTVKFVIIMLKSGVVLLLAHF